MMIEREQIIAELKRFFDLRELVCPHTYAKWEERSWQFLDTMWLWCLLVIRRDILQARMTCNDSGHTQRGLRCNLCELVKSKKVVYLTLHMFGKAGDFIVAGMTAEQARQEIITKADLLPCPIRLEAGASWLHFDVLPQYGVTDKVYLFKA